MELTKGKNGWRALTEIELPDVQAHGARDRSTRPGKTVLQIATSKGVRGGISTTASVHYATEDGGMIHAMGLGTGSGDYYSTVLSSGSKCTEKAIRTLHAEALQHTDAILAHVRQFYAVQSQQRG